MSDQHHVVTEQLRMDSQAFAPLTKPQANPLASRAHLGRVNEGLRGIAGAQTVILQLDGQRTAVTKLTLNRNPLGDDGISHLFRYLSSTDARHPLSEISLNCTELGCEGLQAISDYIRGNEVLRSLWLASNALLPDPTVFSSLASAINDSRLQFLSLTSNSRLGDAFVEQFFPSLHSCHLHELHINSIGLTARSAPVIGAWISGDLQGNNEKSCHLQTLKSNGNRVGANGVWEIVRAIEKGNWTITKMEVEANQLVGLPNYNESAGSMRDAERALHRVVMRNGYWKRQTETDALLLMRYSRSLLMHSESSPTVAPPHSRTATPSFPFYALPNELKLSILGLLAPSLSSTQRLRVFNYACDPSTLPCLLPPLRRDPGNESANPDPSLLSSQVIPNGSQRCYDGKWISASNNGPLTRREERRSDFLVAMGCCAFEPEYKNPS